MLPPLDGLPRRRFHDCGSIRKPHGLMALCHAEKKVCGPCAHHVLGCFDTNGRSRIDVLRIAEIGRSQKGTDLQRVLSTVAVHGQVGEKACFVTQRTTHEGKVPSQRLATHRTTSMRQGPQPARLVCHTKIGKAVFFDEHQRRYGQSPRVFRATLEPSGNGNIRKRLHGEKI